MDAAERNSCARSLTSHLRLRLHQLQQGMDLHPGCAQLRLCARNRHTSGEGKATSWAEKRAKNNANPKLKSVAWWIGKSDGWIRSSGRIWHAKQNYTSAYPLPSKISVNESPFGHGRVSWQLY